METFLLFLAVWFGCGLLAVFSLSFQSNLRGNGWANPIPKDRHDLKMVLFFIAGGFISLAATNDTLKESEKIHKQRLENERRSRT